VKSPRPKGRVFGEHVSQVQYPQFSAYTKKRSRPGKFIKANPKAKIFLYALKQYGSNIFNISS